MQFSEMNIHASILQGLNAAGFDSPTPVQQKTWTEVVENGRDVTVQSQTGTGKTGAFLLPIFQLFMTEGPFKAGKALILAPTRELAAQIHEEASLLGAHLPLKYGCVYGGVGYGQQEAMLKDGVDILIGTPGRLLDFIGSHKVNPKDYNVLVIDEADRLLDMGFFPDMKKIFRMMRPREERRTMLFSATISTRVSTLTWEYMDIPAQIEIQAEQVTVNAIDQRLYHVSREEKMQVLLGIMQTEKPETAIIFCNTKRAAEEVAKRLGINGIPANFIMGDLPQSKRLKIIQDMKDKKVPILVATDVAARGLHVDDLEMVINYDLPEDAENYVHRIGRTARAGASGRARSLSCERYVYHLEAIEKYINGKIPVAAVGEELLVNDASKGMRIRLDSWDDEDRGPNDSRGPRRESRGRDGKPGPRDGRRDGRDGHGRTEKPGEGRTREHGAPKRPHHGEKPQRQARSPERAPAPGPQASLDERIAFYKKQASRDMGMPAAGGTAAAASPKGKRPAPQQQRRGGENRPDQRSAKPRSAAGRPPAPAREVAPAPKQEQQPAPKGIMGWFKRLFRGS